MTKNKWNLPYPDEQEINRQTAIIVQKALPAKLHLLKEMQVFKNQMGWLYLLPNRAETIFTSLLLVLTVFFILIITSAEKTISPNLYGYVFLTAPVSFLLLTGYAFYEKWKKQTLELEMTTKFTFFQVIAMRMLAFSGISLLINMTAALALALNFEVDFLRAWFISLTGLFGFVAGLLWFVARGNVLYRTVLYTAGWMVVNSGWLFAMKDAYLQVVFQLPLVVYAVILLILIGFFFYAFTRAFSRKQEGLWTC